MITIQTENARFALQTSHASAQGFARTNARELRKILGAGKGSDRAICPSCGKGHLSLKDAPNGGLLYHCFSGCDQDTIRWHLKRLGVWPESHLERPVAAPLTPLLSLSKTEERLKKLRKGHFAAQQERAMSTQEHVFEIATRYLQGRGITGDLSWLTTLPLRFRRNLLRDGATSSALILPMYQLLTSDERQHLTQSKDYQAGPHAIGAQQLRIEPDLIDPLYHRKSRLERDKPFVTGSTLSLERNEQKHGSFLPLCTWEEWKQALILYAAEGFETAVAIRSLLQRLGLPGVVICCFTANNLPLIPLPDTCQEVVLCADKDESNTGQRQAFKAARRFKKQGKTTRILLPHPAIPEGTRGVDFLDAYPDKATHKLFTQKQPTLTLDGIPIFCREEDQWFFTYLSNPAKAFVEQSQKDPTIPGLYRRKDGMIGAMIRRKDDVMQCITALSGEGHPQILGSTSRLRNSFFTLGQGKISLCVQGLGLGLEVLEAANAQDLKVQVFGVEEQRLMPAIKAAKRARKGPREKSPVICVFREGDVKAERNAHEAALRHNTDLWCLTQEGALEERQIDPQQALRRALIQHQKQKQEMLASFGPVETIDQEYLSAPTRSSTTGCLALVSAMKTGKTTFMRDVTELYADDTVLYLAHRIALCHNAAKNLNLAAYDDLRDGGQADLLSKAGRYAICLNSLHRLVDKETGRIQAPKVLLLDEFDQVLRALVNFVKGAQKPLIWAILQELIKKAQMIVVADAHLSAISLQLLSALRPDLRILHNTYRENKGTAHIYKSLEGLQQALEQRVQQKQKLYVATNAKNGKRGVHTTHKLLSTSSKHGTYICADNLKDPLTQQWLEAPVETSQPLDYVVTSPSVSTGFSIDGGTFPVVGGIFNAHVGTPHDAAQALHRARDAQEMLIHVEQRHQSPRKVEELEARWNARELDQAMRTIRDGREVFSDPLYEQLCKQVFEQEQRSRAEYAWHLLVELAAQGWTFALHDEEGDKKQAKERQERARQERLREIAEAPVLSPEQKEVLNRRKRRTQAESDALLRTRICEAYSVDPQNMEAVKKALEHDRNGTGRRHLRTLEVNTGNDQQLLEHEQARDGDGYMILRGDIRNDALKREIIRRVLWACGVDAGTLKDLEGYRYHKNSPRVRQLVDWLEQSREVLSGCVRISESYLLQKEPLRFISNILQRLDLKQGRTGRNEKGVYQIDQERLAQQRFFVIRRGNVDLRVSWQPDSWAPLRFEDKSGDTMHV